MLVEFINDRRDSSFGHPFDETEEMFGKNMNQFSQFKLSFTHSSDNPLNGVI